MVLQRWKKFLREIIISVLDDTQNSPGQCLEETRYSFWIRSILNRKLYWDIFCSLFPSKFSSSLSCFVVLRHLQIIFSFFLFLKQISNPPQVFIFLLLHNRNSSCTCKSHLQTSTTRLSDNKTKNPIGFHKTHICRYFCSTVIWWTDSCSFMPHPERLGCRCGKRGQWVIKVSFWVNVKPHPVLAKTQLLFT